MKMLQILLNADRFDVNAIRCKVKDHALNLLHRSDARFFRQGLTVKDVSYHRENDFVVVGRDPHIPQGLFHSAQRD
jgi:hypothetical protein